MKYIATLLAFFYLASPAKAQHWTQLTKGTQPVTYRIPFFIDPLDGFTYDGAFFLGYPSPSISRSTPELRRTTDGGLTWMPIPFFDTVGAGVTPTSITQVCFISRTQGFVSCVGEGAGIYETDDMGLTWHRISPVRGFTGVYAAGRSIFATAIPSNAIDNRPIARSNGPLWYSLNAGLTWDSLTAVEGVTLSPIPEFQRVYGNRDSLVASVYLDSAGLYANDTARILRNIYLIYSRDQGRTWKSSLLDSNYLTWDAALFIPPHSCRIFHEQDPANVDAYNFYSSDSDYTIWDTSITNIQTTAWIAGNGCAMYLTHAPSEVDSINMYRSTDLGNSWVPLLTLGQPAPTFAEIDDYDYQNVSVVGHGAIIYADSFDFVGATLGHSGGLWKSSDGGDGSLNAGALAPRFELTHNLFPSSNDTFSFDPCLPNSIQVYNLNIGCAYGKFDSITLVGLDPSEYSVVSTHHCACQPMPDTSFIALAPTQAGIRNVTIHFHYTDDEFDQIDTTLTVVLDVESGATPLPVTLSLGSGTIMARAGDTIEIPVYLVTDTTILLPNTSTVDFSMLLDTNVLNYLYFDPVSRWIIASESESNEISIGLRARSNVTLTGKTLIGTIHCIVYLVDTLQTQVSLAGASINISVGGCVALSTDLSSVNIAITGCGDSTLLKFMHTGRVPLSITSLSPNPAQTEISVEGKGQGVEGEVADALGRIVIPSMKYSFPFSLEVSSLPNGIYLLHVKSPEGFVSSRQFVIQR